MINKPTASAERMKALMRQHTANAVATMIAPRPIPAAPLLPANSRRSWNRITVRLTAGELEKINDVVIATQHANRSGRVTTTDILRVALGRVKVQEAIGVGEINALRAQDGRRAKDGQS